MGTVRGRTNVAVFVYEAGNSGNNHLDRQRFYACVGWAIDEANVNSCREVVRSVKSQASELKGSRLFRRASGRKTIAQMFADLGRAGAVPYFVLVDKRYSLGGRVVDFFLDSTMNDRISTEWEWEKENGRSVAEVILNRFYLGASGLWLAGSALWFASGNPPLGFLYLSIAGVWVLNAYLNRK